MLGTSGSAEDDLPLQTGQADHLPAAEDGAPGSDQPQSSYDRLYHELFERVRVALRTDVATRTPEQRQQLGLAERNGLLWTADKLLYIPHDVALRHDLLHWHHDVPWCGHLGAEATVKLLRTQFWWPQVAQDIQEYVSSCHSCQANKPSRRKARLPLSPLLPAFACWLTMGVDMIVDLPRTLTGFNAIIVFMCHLSKMVRLVPCDTKLTTEGFARIFLKEIFPHYGMPLNIVSDRGSQWNSEFFKAICDKLGVRLNLSTAYHPQTNGLVERMNETVSAALRHFVSADHKDWDESVPMIEFALNSMYHKSSQSTAFAMNRICLPRNPFTALRQLVEGQTTATCEAARSLGMPTWNDGVRTVAQALDQYQWAKQCVHAAKDRMKAQHDAKSSAPVEYAPGDLVWFNRKNLHLRHPSRRHKLVPRFLGPMRIVELVGRSAVRLDMPASLHVHPTVSVQLVKPYVPRDGVEPPPLIINGEEEYEIEAITAHNLIVSRSRKKASLVEFKAVWKGLYEDSWHEFSDFEHSVHKVEQYLRNYCTPRVRKSIYKAIPNAQLQWLSLDLQHEAK